MAADRTSIENEIQNILIEVSKVQNIKNYDLKPDLEVNVGDGFVSQFYRGKITDKDTGKVLKVAIKKAPTWEWDYKKIFQNEINFYTKVMPALDVLQREANLPDPFDNTPAYLASGTEPKKEFIVLEDLKLDGYILHEKKQPLTSEQLTLIFQTYGKFHALSFLLRKRNFTSYQAIHEDYSDVFNLFVTEESSRKMLVDTLTSAVAALDPGSVAYEQAKDYPKYSVATLTKAFIYNGNYRCSTHGDCWSNNMLFKYSKSGPLEDIKLIDFQLARDGTPIHDLSYFFYSGAKKSDLDALEDYLKIYHDSLSKVVKHFAEEPQEIFPFDVLIKEWKENALMGILLGIYLWQVKLLAKEEYVDILKENSTGTQESSKAAAEELFTTFYDLMNGVNKSEAFRQRARDILTHAVEYGILTKEKIVYEEDANTPIARENV